MYLLTQAAQDAANDPNWLQLGDATNTVRILGFLIPVLTALVTKAVTSSGTKAVVTLVSSALLGATAYLVTKDGGYDWEGFVNSFMNAFLPAIAAYYGLWKPTGVAGTVAAATRGFGIGKPALETGDRGYESDGGRHL